MGSYGQAPSTTLITKATLSMQDCKTSPYTAGAGETAITTSNITAYFTAADQRQFIAGYTVDGGGVSIPSSPANGMASTRDVANVTVNGVLALEAGRSYVFAPVIRPDFSDATLDWVQCSTVAQIVKM